MGAHVANVLYKHLLEGKSMKSLDSSKAAEALDFTVRHLAAISNHQSSESLGPRAAELWDFLTKKEEDAIVDGRLIPFVHFGI